MKSPHSRQLDNAHSAAVVPIVSAVVDNEEDYDGDGTDDGHGPDADEVTSGQAYCLYVSHSLSMWNSRMYEFAVVSIQIYCQTHRGTNRLEDPLHSGRLPRGSYCVVYQVSIPAPASRLCDIMSSQCPSVVSPKPSASYSSPVP